MSTGHAHYVHAATSMLRDGNGRGAARDAAPRRGWSTLGGGEAFLIWVLATVFVVWLFALQTLVFGLLAPRLLRGAMPQQARIGIPWPQLAVLGVAIGAIAMADVTARPLLALAFVALGLAIMLAIPRLDARAGVRMLPHRAGDLRTICGAGYASYFALTGSSMALTVYGPAILQELHGLSPLWAGYVVGAEALAWTLSAIAVAGTRGAGETAWIRRGAFCIALGVILLALTMRSAPLPLIFASAAVMGMGFGLSTALSARRILGVLAEEDRAIGSAALISTRQTGGAVGAAMSGVVANMVGFSAGLSLDSARAAALWVFVAAIPMALAGALAAWRFTGRAVRA